MRYTGDKLHAISLLWTQLLAKLLC